MTCLVRNDIKVAFSQRENVNPSLLLQKGQLDANQKTTHLKEIVKLPASSGYKSAFNRWFDLTQDENRFSQTAMTLENRLLIGLTGNATLETGCSLSRNYGMPYIPGSSVKGVVRAWANQHLAGHSDELEQLFGTADSEQLYRVSGLVTFHDAWWIPAEGAKPFVLDVVTTHHQDYYNGKKIDGEQVGPSDKDSPIPNHLLAVQGSFLFVLEGEPAAIELCQTIVEKALADNGIGAKTAAGYGYMKVDQELMQRLLDEHEKRLPQDVREHRQAEAQRRNEQQLEAAAKAEQAKPPVQIIAELRADYLKHRDNAAYQLKVENWIDTAIKSWTEAQDRALLAECLKQVGYEPSNKKNPNHLIRKTRLQQLKDK